ncbi:MAG: type VI secretion system protein TssA [Syntrophorhabdaceae bacterium]
MDYRELGAKPIPGSEGAGSDIRSTDIFEKLSGEIDKMSSPSASGALDWTKVLDVSAQILDGISKDLLVASYFSLALLKIEGLTGLAIGVHVWRDMLSSYWDSLFPARTRMRGRRNAIDWWVEKLSGEIRELPAVKWEQNAIDSLYADLNAIDAFLRDNMDDAPAVGPLMSIIGSVLAPVEEKRPIASEPASISVQPVPSANKPAVSSAGAPLPARNIEPVPGGDDPDVLIKHGIETLRAASASLMANNALTSLYFRLNRAVAWITVSALPPNHGGRTLLEAPDEEVRDLLKMMRDSGNWKNLLAACESRISQHLFWLDLSRYVAEALDQLGQKTQAREVAGMTAFYVDRLPGIEKLTFTDGTPFADQITRKWLADARRDSSGDPLPASGDAIATRIETDMAAAKTLVAEGNVPGAAGQLREAITRASSVRERFMRQVHFCRFLIENNQNKLSGSYLTELVGLIDTYRLGDWEPSLAAEAYDVILTGISSPGMEEAGLKDVEQDVFKRLSLIDPVKAMQYA